MEARQLHDAICAQHLGETIEMVRWKPCRGSKWTLRVVTDPRESAHSRPSDGAARVP